MLSVNIAEEMLCALRQIENRAKLNDLLLNRLTRRISPSKLQKVLSFAHKNAPFSVRRSKPPPTKKYFITIIISPKYIIVKQIFIKESASTAIIIKHCQIIIKNMRITKNKTVIISLNHKSAIRTKFIFKNENSRELLEVNPKV